MISFNPHRGKRTLGPSESEVEILVGATLAQADVQTKIILNKPLDVAKFPVQTKLLRHVYTIRRADGVEVPYQLVLNVHDDDPDGSRFPTGGIGHLRGERVIGLTLNARAAFAVSTWRDLLGQFFAHELTHLKDPEVHQTRQNRGSKPSTMADQWRPEDEAGWSVYFNDPVEITARRHEIFRDLQRPAVRMVVRRFTEVGRRHEIVETALSMTEVWRDIKRHLSPKNQRVIRQMAAKVVLDLLDAPKGSAARRPVSARTLGTQVRDWCRLDVSYGLLDRHALGNTWFSGGCWALAVAIGLQTGSRLVAIVDGRGVPQHVGVQVGDRIVDADGAVLEASWVRRWRTREGIVGAHVEAFGPALQRKAEAAEMARPSSSSVAKIRAALFSPVKRGSRAPTLRYVLDRKGNAEAARWLNDNLTILPKVEWICPSLLEPDDQDGPRTKARLASIRKALLAGTPLPAILVHEGDRTIEDGHHRLQVALELGIERVPVQWLRYR